MWIKKVTIDELKLEDTYNFSYPLRPGVYLENKKKFPGLPSIVIDRDNKIIFGIDYYHHLKSTVAKETTSSTSTVKDKEIETVAGTIEVLQVGISEREALYLAYNLKNKFTGINLYEKLLFVRQVFRHEAGNCNLKEKELVNIKSRVYQGAALDLNINRELVEHLDMLLGEEFKEILAAEKITLKTALGLCTATHIDSGPVLQLFDRVSFTASQQLKILEMLEEICFRDKCAVDDILKKLQIANYFEETKPQKKIIDIIFSYRNPIYVEKEKEWQQLCKELGLPSNVKVSHFPFFEKKQVDVHIRLDTQEPGKLRKLAARLTDFS